MENLKICIKSSISFSSFRIAFLLITLLAGFFLGNIYYQKYSTIYVKYLYDYSEPIILNDGNSTLWKLPISSVNLFDSAKTLLADEIKTKCEFRNLKYDSARGIHFAISLKVEDYVFIGACEDALKNSLSALIDGEFAHLRIKILEEYGQRVSSNAIKPRNIPFVYRGNIAANFVVVDTLRPSRQSMVLISGFLFAGLAQLFLMALCFIRKFNRLVKMPQDQ